MSRAARAGRGIDLVEPVTLGGITQWISLRSDDESSPLILFLHGGPGTAQISFSRKPVFTAISSS